MPHSLFIQRTSCRAAYSYSGYQPTSRIRFHEGLQDFWPSNTRKKDNGTRLIVKALQPHVIDAEVSTGPSKGKRVFLPRINMDCS